MPASAARLASGALLAALAAGDGREHRLMRSEAKAAALQPDLGPRGPRWAEPGGGDPDDPDFRGGAAQAYGSGDAAAPSRWGATDWGRSLPSNPPLPQGYGAGRTGGRLRPELAAYSVRSMAESSDYRTLHRLFASKCPGPMWAAGDFVCQEAEEAPEENKWVDIHGHNRIFFEHGAKCTVQCPAWKYWQLPDIWEMECHEGRWEATADWQTSFVSRKMDGINCRTAIWFWVVSCGIVILEAGAFASVVMWYRTRHTANSTGKPTTHGLMDEASEGSDDRAAFEEASEGPPESEGTDEEHDIHGETASSDRRATSEADPNSEGHETDEEDDIRVL